AHTLCKRVHDSKDESEAEGASHPQREDRKELGDCCPLERRAFKLGIVGRWGVQVVRAPDNLCSFLCPPPNSMECDGLSIQGYRHRSVFGAMNMMHRSAPLVTEFQ